MTEYSLRYVDAISDRPGDLNQHLRGQEAALGDFGIEARPIMSWKSCPLEAVSLVHVVETQSDTVVGGMAVYFRRPGLVLPSERTLTHPDFCAQISAALSSGEHLCELCGAWIDNAHRKQGLLPFLFFGSVVAAQLGGATLNISTAHAKAALLYERLGTEIDWDQHFCCPDERYRTHVARVDIARATGPQARESALLAKITAAFQKKEPFKFSIPAPGSNHRPTLLVVEDDLELRTVLASELAKSLDAKVKTADGVQAAKKILLAEGIDLILCDMRITDGTALDLAHWLHTKEGSRPPMLIMSGHVPRDSAGLKAPGVLGYVSKPFHWESLLNLVETNLPSRLGRTL